MSKEKGKLTEEYFHLLNELEKQEALSQRELSKKLGYSLGKINFILKSLVEKGLIKIDNFAHSNQKTKYCYVLTPEGIKQKYQITKAFIERKEAEFEKLKKEIEKAKKSIN